MATSRPFSYNTGALIPGTTQSGNIAAGYPTAGFAATGLQWWNGPDEDLGYVIANPKPSNNQPTPDGKSASVGFWRSSALTDNSFISLVQSICKTQSFASTTDAKTWLTNSGYWTSYLVSLNTLNTDIYAAWNGDNTNNVLDTSIYGVWNGDNSPNDSYSTNDGTLVNGVTYSTGKIGQAFRFDGIDDYVRLPDNIMQFNGDFSISVWVYHVASGAQTILGNEYYRTTPSYNYSGWSLFIDNLSATTHKVGFIIPKGTTNQYTGWEFNTTSLTQNAWNHIVLVRVAGVNTYCWINGLAQSYALKGTGANITTNPTYFTTQKCAIGASTGALTSANYMKSGSKVNGLTVWDRALTTTEVNELYNITNGVQYPFVGKTLPSFTATYGSNNLTSVNGAKFNTGKINSAFSFDGIDDYATLPNNTLNLTGDFSISFWVKLNSLTGNQFFINAANVSGGLYRGFAIVKNITTNLVDVQMYNTNVGTDLYSTTALSANTWTHIVLTRKSGTRSRLYINGVLNNSNTSTMDPNYYTQQLNQIGGYKPDAATLNYITNGYIDAVAVWQKELSDSEVTDLYNSGNGKEYLFT